MELKGSLPWRFMSSGLWCCVIGWGVSDILTVPDTFIIRVKHCLTLMMNPAVFQNVRNHLKLLAWWHSVTSKNVRNHLHNEQCRNSNVRNHLHNATVYIPKCQEPLAQWHIDTSKMSGTTCTMTQCYISKCQEPLAQWHSVTTQMSGTTYTMTWC